MVKTDTYLPGRMKGYIRDSVFLYFSNCKSVLTLPNLYFDLEKKFLDKGINIECVEYKNDTFKNMQQIVPKGIKLYNQDVKNLDLSKYDGMFLDFCGTFNDSAEVVLKKIKPKTKIAITFLMSRESKRLQKKINIKNRRISYIVLFEKYNIIIDYFMDYNDITPMCVFFGYKT